MGRARVAKFFTLDRMVAETESLYSALLSAHGRRAAPGTGR
jgi:hypothetical protein